MHCPHCASVTTKEQIQKTTLGYRTFRCSACKHLFNERTRTPFNFLEYPTDVVLLVVLWRLRYKLSLRDLAEIFLERGWEFTYETAREWEMRFTPLITEQLRTKRCGQAGRSWYVDETYVKVRGNWCYLYPGGFTAERETRYGGSPTVFQARSHCCWPCSGTGDNGRACLLPTSSA